MASKKTREGEKLNGKIHGQRLHSWCDDRNCCISFDIRRISKVMKLTDEMLEIESLTEQLQEAKKNERKNRDEIVRLERELAEALTT